MDVIVHQLLKYHLLIKLYHWQTKTYAKHIASDSLYDKTSKNIDLIVESIQGEHSTRVKFAKDAVLHLDNMTDKSIVVVLNEFKLWMETEFGKIAQSKYLLNIRDEIVTDINQTLYLFSLA